MQNLPIIHVSVGETLSLIDISKATLGIPISKIKVMLQEQIKEHHRLFGTNPFKIEYSYSGDSYEIRPNSVIGRLDCEQFILEIASKFEDIQIGKWLQLAHYSGANYLVQHNNSISETAVSEDDIFQGVDYFVLALVSSIGDCIDQGLLYKKDYIEGPDPNFSGKLHVRNHIQMGGNPFRIQTIRNIKNFNCTENIILKRALEIAAMSALNSKLRGLANGLINSFQEINTDGIANKNFDYSYSSSVPRHDYKKALAVSKIILEGFSSLYGDLNSFSPYYTINLDQLFERFVAYELQQLLKSDTYQVKVQEKKSHKIEPELPGSFISPDILVYPNEMMNSRPIVIDTKNKYSTLIQSGGTKISNTDLYQMIYYCQTVGTNIAMLVYPGTSITKTKYPIPGSEGKTKYLAKRDAALIELKTSNNHIFNYKGGDADISIIIWRLDLSGTLRDCRQSMAELSQFVADCVKQEIL